MDSLIEVEAVQYVFITRFSKSHRTFETASSISFITIFVHKSTHRCYGTNGNLE